MPDYDFSKVGAAIVDSQHSTLRLFRDVLIRVGFGKVETYGSFLEAAAPLREATPELIVLGCDGDDAADAFKLVRALRNDAATQNPYAGIIVTSWLPTQALLARVSAAGADDLLMKPVSPQQVWDRIAVLMEGRKRFVVTADYTGPDRRKTWRPGAQVPLIEVPNLLRLKATGCETPTTLRRLVAEANAQINEQKLIRIGVQIAFLLEFASSGLSAVPPERLVVEHLARVPGFLDEMQHRLSDQLAPDEAGGAPIPAKAVCQELKTLVERIRARAEKESIDDVTQMRAWDLACALMQATDAKRPLSAMTREVLAAVAAYRSQLQQLAQAKAAS
jgi:DNA-binding response OmpR family regulator